MEPIQTKHVGLEEDIDITLSTQIRETSNPDTIDEYAEAMRLGVEFPPVSLFDDGERLYVADGFHRIQAAEKAERRTILANIYDGGLVDAIRFGLGSNISHGLRRTQADKRRAVILALEHFGDWSDRKIAEECRVSPFLVATVRTETGARNGTSKKKAKRETHDDEKQERLGRDGKRYTVNGHDKDPYAAYLNSAPSKPPVQETDWIEEIKRAKRSKMAKNAVELPTELADEFISMRLDQLFLLARDRRPINIVQNGYLIRIKKLLTRKP